MIKEHPNIEVLKRFDPNNAAATTEVIAEDAVFHFINPKLPQLQGDYVGPEGFVDFFRKMAELSKGTFKVSPVSGTMMGDEMAVTHVVDTMEIRGHEMEVDAVVVWRILDGKIREAWDIPALNSARFVKAAS